MRANDIQSCLSQSRTGIRIHVALLIARGWYLEAMKL